MDEPLTSVFGNAIPWKYIKKARRTFRTYASRFDYDPSWKPSLAARPLPGAWEHFGVRQILPAGSQPGPSPVGNPLPDLLPLPTSAASSVILGTIRMGYGHYRIALAIASAAKSLGLTPYWLDFLSFPESAASKTLRYLNDLYSLGSRLSQKFKLFNRLVWEHFTSESGLRLTSSVRDRELSRLFAPVIGDLDREVPFLATHPWTGHAAVHAGMEHIVTVVPDNYPLSFHLVEGTIHAVQTPSNYLGYRTLRNMGRPNEGPLFPMPPEQIKYTGHFVDHEIVGNIESDTDQRFKRLRDRRAKRLLLTMGGAGAQGHQFLDIIRYCRPALEEDRAVIFINMGDHQIRWREMSEALHAMRLPFVLHDNWDETQSFSGEALEGKISGLHIFLSTEIFPAVYATNLLMRASDVMVTKPSELSFYPVPKLFIQRVGRHEAWGAIRGADIGDGTLETQSLSGVRQALSIMLTETDLLRFYSHNILNNHRIGIYNGAYQAVKLAVGAVKPV